MIYLVIKWISLVAWLTTGAQAAPIVVPMTEESAVFLLTDLVEATPDSSDPAALTRTLDHARVTPTQVSGRRFFQEGRLWFRLEISNPSTESRRLVLMNSFPVFSQWLLDPSAPAGPVMQRTGLAETANTRGTPDDVIRLDVSPGTKTYYIGVLSRGIPYFPVMTLQHQDDHDHEQASRSAVLLFGLGAFVTGISTVLILGIWLRAKMFTNIALSGICYLPLILILSGQAFLLPTDWRIAIIKIWPIFTVLSMTFIVKFGLEFVNIRPHQHPLVHTYGRAFILLPVMCLPLFFVNDYVTTMIYIGAAGLALVSVQLIALKRCIVDRDLYATLYSICFLPITISDCLVLAEFSGIIAHHRAYTDLQFLAITLQAMMLLVPIGIKVVGIRENAALLRRHLKGIIADHRISDVALAGAELLKNPVEQYVTVLFVDIVGYSLIFERMKSIEAFSALKTVINSMVAIVHKHGGVVDKSLGDGLLAFFGYDLADGSVPNHEATALACARDIQMEAVLRCLDPLATALPLRIGINSDTVNIGNIGNEERFDVTVSGGGVVLASRFESACEPFKIVLGESTFSALPEHLKSANSFNPIKVPIKHQNAPKLAYEYDPFCDDPTVTARALNSYRIQNNLRVQHSRSILTEPIAIKTSFGPMQLVNYSIGGMCLIADVLLGRGIHVDLYFDVAVDHPAYLWLNPLGAEVVWSAATSDGWFTHGLKFKGHSKEQCEVVLRVIDELIRKSQESQEQQQPLRA